MIPFVKSKIGIVSFGLAALSAPVAMFIPSAFGIACGRCPVAGDALLSRQSQPVSRASAYEPG